MSRVEQRSIAQKKQMLLQEKITEARNRIEAIEKKGQKKSKEWKRLVDLMNEMIMERDNLNRQDKADRDELGTLILVCFACADLACEATHRLHAKLDDVFGKVSDQTAEAAFADSLTQVADSFQKIVNIIDFPADKGFSWNFAEMSDEVTEQCTESLTDKVAEIVVRHQEQSKMTIRNTSEWRNRKKQINNNKTETK